MYKNIMVAIDDSDMATLALNEAMNLAYALHSKLYVIHVIDLSLPPSTDIAYVAVDFDKYIKTIKRNGEELLDKVKIMAKNIGVDVDTKLIENKNYGVISEKILESADNLAADLLVLCSHGRRGFRRFFIGSVTEETIRTTKIPVLIVHGNSKED